MPLKYRDGNDTYIVEQYYEDVDFGASFGATGISNTAGLELTGPAGGWIFYAKPSYSYDLTGPFSEANGGKPWRYLECSPNYTDSTTGGSTEGFMRWGRYGVLVGAAYGADGYNETGAPVALSTDGNGLRNSYIMWAVDQNRSYWNVYNAVEATNAIAYCFGLHAGGYSDWYLPSSGEYYYIWWNLISDRDPTISSGRGGNTHAASKGFNPSGQFWTSTEATESAPYNIQLASGAGAAGQIAADRGKQSTLRTRAIRRF